MKAILEFDLPEDRKQHMAAVKATSMAIALFDIVYNVRKRAENRIEAVGIVDPYDAVELIFHDISDILDEQGIIIDELIE